MAQYSARPKRPVQRFCRTAVSDIQSIRRARYLGFTLEAVRELLTLSDDNEQSCEAVDHIATAHLAEVERKIADLSGLHTELTRVLGSCRHGTITNCKIIETLAPNR